MSEVEPSKVKSSMKKAKFLILICTFTFYLSPITFYSYAQDKIIAIVNNEIVTQKDLDEFIYFVRLQFSSEYQGKELEDKIQSLKADLFKKLIEDKIILQEAKKNKLNLDEDRIKAKMDEVKKRYSSLEEFQQALAKDGLVPADIERKMRDQLLMITIVDEKVRRKIIVTPSEVSDYYQSNKQEFELGQQREIEAVLINDENTAKSVNAQLKKEIPLDDLVNTYSLTVNKLKVTKNELRPEIEKAVFSLGLNQISEPVKSEEGFYVFRLNKIIPPRQQDLSEAQDQINSLLFNQKMKVELNKWLEGLKKKSYIKIF